MQSAAKSALSDAAQRSWSRARQLKMQSAYRYTKPSAMIAFAASVPDGGCSSGLCMTI